MNKESSIKQLKRIKQDMTHADDVNALDFAIRFMGNKTLDKIRAEFEELRHYYPMGHDYQIAITRCLAVIDKYRVESEL